MPLRGVVFNRVHRELAAPRQRLSTEEVKRVLAHALGAALPAARLAENFTRYEALGRGDGLRLEAFRRQLGRDTVVAEVPNFNSDVHSMAGLQAMHPFLFAA